MENPEYFRQSFIGNLYPTAHVKPTTSVVPNLKGLNMFKYLEFVSSSTAFVPEDLQKKIRISKFLIAGTGSIGNPIAMMLARSGAENITNADPENIEISNLARQEFSYFQVGNNKAEMTTQNIIAINPDAANNTKSVPEGITQANVEGLVNHADIIIDGIDIRSSEFSWELHKYAAMLRKPVIVGYDLAGTAMIKIYRYDIKPMKPLNNEITEEKIQQFLRIKSKFEEKEITESQFVDYVYEVLTGPINPFLVPVEQLREIINRKDGETSTAQIGTTARLISVLAVEAIKQILAGNPVKGVINADSPSLVRKNNPSVFTKIKYMLGALSVIRKRGKKVRDMLSTLGSL